MTLLMPFSHGEKRAFSRGRKGVRKGREKREKREKRRKGVRTGLDAFSPLFSLFSRGRRAEKGPDTFFRTFF